MATVSAATYVVMMSHYSPHHRRSAISSRQLLHSSCRGTRRALRFCPLSTSSFAVCKGFSVRFRDEDVQLVNTVSALPEDVPTTVTLSVVLASILGFAGFRAYVYFNIQFMIAALLGRCVPRGGCKVLDMDIHEGRNLYYYPNDIKEVVALTDKKNYEIVKNQAIRAGVPVDIKVKPISSVSLPSNSMDAVVSVYSLCNLDEREAKKYLREAIRLLKPGKPFIFLENVVAEGNFLRTCQILLHRGLQIFGFQTSPPRDVSKVLEEAEGLENLEYKSLFGFQDPHITGLAFKQMQAANNSTTNKKRGSKRSVST